MESLKIRLLGSLFIPLLVLLTSACSIYMVSRVAGLKRGSLLPAVRVLLETIGLTVAFFVINSLAGLVIIDILRLIFRTFISHYLVTGTDMSVLSLGQAIIVREYLIRRGS